MLLRKKNGVLNNRWWFDIAGINVIKKKEQGLSISSNVQIHFKTLSACYSIAKPVIIMTYIKIYDVFVISEYRSIYK